MSNTLNLAMNELEVLEKDLGEAVTEEERREIQNAIQDIERDLRDLSAIRDIERDLLFDNP